MQNVEAVETLTSPARTSPKRLNLFERYLTAWVGLCMITGVLLGKALPGMIATVRGMEFGEASHINIPIAVLIWLMIYPMMLKVDFPSVLEIGKRPKGLLARFHFRDPPDYNDGDHPT